MRHAPTWILLLAAAVAGCGMETDERPATFSYIHQAIIVPSCATAACHSTQNHIAGKDFQTRSGALATFQEANLTETSSIYRLIGGDASGLEDDAYRYLEIYRMPADSPLPDADILLIGRWIDDGSQDN